MGKIYQGESINLVFRCKHKCGVPMDMVGMEISVILRDNLGDVVYRFSTTNLNSTKPIKVDANYVICRLTNKETANLVGSYLLEVKVKKQDLVMIDVSKKIKVYASVIGEDVSL